VRDAVSGEPGVTVGERFFPCSDAVGTVLRRLSSDRNVAFDALAEGLNDEARRELEQLMIRLVAIGAIFVDLDR
jgi:hypothetical protein